MVHPQGFRNPRNTRNRTNKIQRKMKFENLNYQDPQDVNGFARYFSRRYAPSELDNTIITENDNNHAEISFRNKPEEEISKASLN